MGNVDEILNYVEVDALLSCAGQPRAEDFAALGAGGFKEVINLATAASTGHLPDEAELCAGAGMGFTWLPVAWDAPTLQDFEAFRAWLAPRRQTKTLVHCAKNWRASLFVALYRVLEEGLSPDAAWEEVLSVWEPDGAWTGLARAVLSRAGSPLPEGLKK
ncbi:protein tyrosine phosphatase family protein [Fundidesulfovibrio agrisoli]|uniref:protein tyrosine phosphatase family protein n=1 Tax=Fundidesulfovibrio agrisoli TaxID=2922717 RepID=UPI001FAD8BC7|nr:protein tyrosine phosphatase family protein [Fundidesulfovibrio agrisoli]